jgi:hypothetical protein
MPSIFDSKEYHKEMGERETTIILDLISVIDIFHPRWHYLIRKKMHGAKEREHTSL